MDATNMLNSAPDFLKTIQKRHKHLQFTPANSFYWSPQKATIFYEPAKLDIQTGQWALLHEVAHALLGHTAYQNDVSLLIFEVAAWEKAKQLAHHFGIIIDLDHIEDCLDTYRDWLYARSTCPTCSLNALQVSSNSYKCVNCSCLWQVSPSRFCRPYRMQSRHKKTSPEKTPATFQ